MDVIDQYVDEVLGFTVPVGSFRSRFLVLAFMNSIALHSLFGYKVHMAKNPIWTIPLRSFLFTKKYYYVLIKSPEVSNCNYENFETYKFYDFHLQRPNSIPLRRDIRLCARLWSTVDTVHVSAGKIKIFFLRKDLKLLEISMEIRFSGQIRSHSQGRPLGACRTTGAFYRCRLSIFRGAKLDISSRKF